jgi:dihydrofolate reductase
MRVVEYDTRSGGRYRYIHRDSDGNEYGFRGVFHTVVADELIIQTFEFDGAPGQVSLESTAFEDLGERTRVHTHSVFPSVETRDAMIESGMEHGLRDSMDRLAETVTAKAAEPPRAHGKVVVDITMSLDGYVTADGVDLDHGLGVDGEVLHEWVFDKKSVRDSEILDTSLARTGAVIMGRHTFDFVDGPNGWDETLGYGAAPDHPAAPPVFVLTHAAPEKVRLEHRFTFVTDGLRSAVAKAQTAANGADVVIMGGGRTASEFLYSGLVDVLVLHIAPVVLGSGTPLFPTSSPTALRLELADSVSTPAAQHMTYRVRSGSTEV